jgi:hypothetical protein
MTNKALVGDILKISRYFMKKTYLLDFEKVINQGGTYEKRT